MFTHTSERLIEWGDCDPAGIVFYPRFLAFFDAATAALFQAATGMTKREMQARFEMVGFPMVDLRARFIAPLRFGDVARIETALSSFGRSSFSVHQRLFLAGNLSVSCEETRVWVARDRTDPQAIKARAIPPEVRACFAPRA